MNIFYLHNDPQVCAAYHCDKHVVKMILEYAQLLSTAHHELDGVPAIECYSQHTRTTHQQCGQDRVCTITAGCIDCCLTPAVSTQKGIIKFMQQNERVLFVI